MLIITVQAKQTRATLHGCKFQSCAGKIICCNGPQTPERSPFCFECTNLKPHYLQGSWTWSRLLCGGCGSGKLSKCDLPGETKQCKWNRWHDINGNIIWHGLAKKGWGVWLTNWAWCFCGFENRKGDGVPNGPPPETKLVTWINTRKNLRST